MPRPAKKPTTPANELADVARLVTADQPLFKKGDVVYLKHEKLVMRTPPGFGKPAVVTRLTSPSGSMFPNLSYAMQWLDFAFLASDPDTGKFTEYTGDSSHFRLATPEELAAFTPPSGA